MAPEDLYWILAISCRAFLEGLAHSKEVEGENEEGEGWAKGSRLGPLKAIILANIASCEKKGYD